VPLEILEQLRRYDEAGEAGEAGEDISCSVISAFLHEAGLQNSPKVQSTVSGFFTYQGLSLSCKQRREKTVYLAHV